MMEWYVPTYGEFVCDFISHFPTTSGPPFVLYDWQREFLMEFYSSMIIDDRDEMLRRYQYLYLEIPKKNGKSELAAALGLYHLFADGELNAEVYICAADKENAGIVFNAAVYMLQNAHLTSQMLEAGTLKIVESRRLVLYRQLQKTSGGSTRWVTVGRMQVLSSEAYSKHGYKPSCVIFDELHAQPNRDLWDIMTFGSGSSRKQPVWIVLTTAGDDPDRHSIGWEVHEKAVSVRDARQLRKIQEAGGNPRQVLSLRHVDADDMDQATAALLERDLDNWLPVLYGLTATYGDDPDDLAKIDIFDEDVWRKCNPALGKHLSIRTLRTEAKEARTSEASEKLFRWLRLNQWIAVKAVSWLSLTLYDKLQWGPSRKTDREAWITKLNGLTCYGGVDLSSTTDLTAFVLFFPAQKGLEHAVWLPYIWRSSKDLADAERRDRAPYRDWERAGFLTICLGDTIDFASVEEKIVEANRLYDMKMVGFDPYLSRTITQRISPLVKGIIEIPQDMKNMSPAMKEIETGVLNRKMLHVHNTCFRWTWGNVRCAVDGNENKKPMKNKSPGRIDPVVALITAVSTWMICRNQKADLSQAIDRPDFSL